MNENTSSQGQASNPEESINSGALLVPPFYFPNQNMYEMQAAGWTEQAMMQYQQQQQVWQQQQQQLMAQQQQLLALQEQLQNNCTSDSNRHKRRRGRVGFEEDVYVYSNPRQLEEITQSWYTKDELAVFKGERRNLVKELKKVNFDLDRIDRSVFHLRGLEPYLSVGFNKLMLRKRAEVLRTVMREQSSQRCRGNADGEALRAACSQASEWARQKAQDLGRRDAKAVGNGKKEYEWGHDSDLSESPPSVCSASSSSAEDSPVVKKGTVTESMDVLRSPVSGQPIECGPATD